VGRGGRLPGGSTAHPDRARGSLPAAARR